MWKTAGSYQRFLRTLRSRRTRFTYGFMVQRIIFKNHRSCPYFSTMDLKLISRKCRNITSLKLYQRVNRMDVARMIVKSFPNLQTFECKHINFAGLQGLITGAVKLKSLTSQFEDDITDEAAESLAFAFAKLESLRI